MTTPFYLTGFEHGVTPSTNGGGLAAFVQGVAIDSTEHNTGSYSLKATPSAAAAYMRITLATPGEIAGRLYFKITTESASDEQIFDFNTTTGGTTTNVRVWASPASNLIKLGAAGTIVATSSNAYVVNQWHYIDFSFDINQNPWSLKAKLDGGTEFSGTSNLTADTFASFRIGATGGASTLVVYYDDVVLTSTLADYPLGPGGTQILVPNGAGIASNPGTNVMEEANGTDCGANSYLALNSIPMGDATNYIRQAATGNTNYIGVAFSNISATHSAILGAMAILAYTSATTTTNKGGCIVSKDQFASSGVVWGDQATPADYSDGSTANPFWKTVIVPGVVDDTTVNAIEARLGFSTDANPIPYWLDLAVEAAYTIATTDINLDLVICTCTFPAITLLENIVVPLDLVTYSSTFPAASLVENIDIPLDLVTYSSAIPDVTVLENVVVPLDLVTYSSTVPAVTILENVVVPLDLVSYSSSFPAVTILENVVVPLDLVTYTSSFPVVTFNESSVTNLDLVTYSSSFPAMTLLENTIVPLDLAIFTSSVPAIVILENIAAPLDLVTYAFNFPALTVLESVVEPLELVSYSSTIHNIELLEEGSIGLDLVTYSSNVYDLTVIENAIELLDLVPFSSVYPALTLLENVLVPLDLVPFTSVIPNVLFVSPYDTITTPMGRIRSVPRERRIRVVLEDNRIVPVAFSSRVYPIR
jgi:hypothetical protein